MDILIDKPPRVRGYERRTTLDEVQVLCKNHHAQAHHELRQAIFFKPKPKKTL